MAKTVKLNGKNESRMPSCTAQRGDFAITKRIYNRRVLKDRIEYDVEVTVSRVTKVRRNGFAAEVKPLSNTAAPMREQVWDEIVLLKPSKLKNVDGFVAECTARQTPDPDTFAPFESIEDVRETARKYR